MDWQTQGKWMTLSVLVGTIAGLGAIVFQFLTQLAMRYSLGNVAGYLPREPVGEHSFFPHQTSGFSPGLLIVVAICGGLVSGILVFWLAPEAEGHGTDAAIDSFHNKRGEIRIRVPLIKTITSAITIGTGGSGGREGPIAQIGAGFGSYLGQLLDLSVRDRRILLAAGMGAGVGAIFRAPLAGALFAAEILYSDPEFESDVIVPAAMSSIIGYTVYTLSLPANIRFAPLFGTGLNFPIESPLEFLLYGLLAFFLVAVAIVYIKTFYGVHSLFKKLPIPRHFAPALGAGMAATIGVGLWYFFNKNNAALSVLSTGYGILQDSLSPDLSPSVTLLLCVALAKILTTSLTISSGGSGGVFGPSMVIGGCTGAAFGQIVHKLFPNVVQHPQAFVIVGMAGFFAGAANAPISTIIMVSEMTGNYSLLMPTMLCCTLTYLLCRPWRLYTKQVPSRLDSPAHRGDFLIDMLEGIKVREVYRPLTDRVRLIPESMHLDEIVHILAETHQHYFPVVDDERKIVGIFSTQDVRTYLYDESIWHLAVANDIMTQDVIAVTPDDDLNTALTRFTAKNIDELPVVDVDDPGKLLGMLRRKETISFYNKRLMAHRNWPPKRGSESSLRNVFQLR
ncbi:MAG: chloride channel protein [Pirellulaceae bacterium]